MTESGREPESDDERWDPFAASESGPPAAGSPPSERESAAADESWSPDDGDGTQGHPDPADEDGTYRLSVPRPASPERLDTQPSKREPPHDRSEQALSGPEGAPREAARRRQRKRRRARDRLPRFVPDVSLRTALVYPFEGSGTAVLVIYSLLLGMSRVTPVVGPLLALVVLVWMGLLFLESANYTLEGIPGGPRFPSIDLTDLQVGLFGLTVMMIGMLPYVVGRSMMSRLGGESPVWELLFWPLPLYYLPMAFVVLADAESERGLDPRLVFRAIGRVGSQYGILVTLAAAAFVVPSVTFALLGLPSPFREIVNSLLIMYLMVALLRAVGILYLRRGIVSGELPVAPEGEPSGSTSGENDEVEAEQVPPRDGGG